MIEYWWVHHEWPKGPWQYADFVHCRLGHWKCSQERWLICEGTQSESPGRCQTLHCWVKRNLVDNWHGIMNNSICFDTDACCKIWHCCQDEQWSISERCEVSWPRWQDQWEDDEEDIIVYYLKKRRIFMWRRKRRTKENKQGKALWW